MSLILKDRISETTTTTGTGAITLAGPTQGFQAFSTIGNTNTTYYCITDGGAWEVGLGTYSSSGNTLARTTVFATSSGTTSPITLGVGTKNVFAVYPADRAVVVDGTTIQIPNNAVLPVANGGTGSATASFSGANITSLNASNISSGILAVAQGGTGSATAAFSGENITSLNASNISSGTLANARTTASSSNGASTIVARGASGEFSAGTITATFSGDGSAVTSLNASNVSSGTLDNARTSASSANGASTIVARDASGNFAGNTITASSFSGSGASLTSLNGSSISSGTVSNDRTTASSVNGANTIVLRDASGDFAADIITANSFAGSGASLTGLNADAITSGTIANARTTATHVNGASTIVARDASGNFAGAAITGTSFSGSGTSLTSLNASNISAGTLAVARGGTGTGTTPTNGQLLIGNGSGFTLATITAGTGITVSTGAGSTTVTNAGVTSATGTTNQITVSASTGAVTFSLPQSINTGASVQFGSFGVGTAASGTTGEIRATNNITAYYSDDRLKTKLGNIENALEKVCSLSGFFYEANETAQALGYDPIREVGLSAQQVQKVLPEVVVPAPIDSQYLTLRYEKLVPLLVEAIKELKERIEKLEG